MPPTTVGIGDKLREARIDRALSIEETAWRTRIRPEMLRALEDEDFDALGHAAFVRSHLLSYARFLGVDSGEIVDEFERTVLHAIPSPIEELERQRREAKRPPRPKWLIAAALSATVLAAAGVIGALGGKAERPGPEAALPGVGGARTQAQGTSVPLDEARVTLRIEAVRTATVSVLADDRQIFEGTLDAGSTKTFRARDVVELVVSDGDAIRVTHNGANGGTAGDRGEVTRVRFGPAGRLDS